MGGPAARPAPAEAATTTLTNLAHLDFLLDDVSPKAVTGHTTYRLAEEPELLVPWTYADRKDDGSYSRVGGGTLDEKTGDYTQGAFNTDDIARAAVVYLRHWQQTGSADSRTKAYDLLRAVAYLQTTSGPSYGRSILWMQADGTLNPSAEPAELPDPSDSADSYWQARSLWAYGEGYAAFKREDPAFARVPARPDPALGARAEPRRARPLRRLRAGRRRQGPGLADPGRFRRERRGGARAERVRRRGEERRPRPRRAAQARPRDREDGDRPGRVAVRRGAALGAVAVRLARLELAAVGRPGPERARCWASRPC